jgi:hypothetical protein
MTEDSPWLFVSTLLNFKQNYTINRDEGDSGDNGKQYNKTMLFAAK